MNEYHNLPRPIIDALRYLADNGSTRTNEAPEMLGVVARQYPELVETVKRFGPEPPPGPPDPPDYVWTSKSVRDLKPGDWIKRPNLIGLPVIHAIESVDLHRSFAVVKLSGREQPSHISYGTIAVCIPSPLRDARQRWEANPPKPPTRETWFEYEITVDGRDVLALQCAEPPDDSIDAQLPKKRGRRSTIEQDRKIAQAYEDGLEKGLWEGQADYLRQKHLKRWNQNSNAAKAWLTTLLKRVKEAEEG